MAHSTKRGVIVRAAGAVGVRAAAIMGVGVDRMPAFRTTRHPEEEEKTPMSIQNQNIWRRTLRRLVHKKVHRTYPGHPPTAAEERQTGAPDVAPLNFL